MQTFLFNLFNKRINRRTYLAGILINNLEWSVWKTLYRGFLYAEGQKQENQYGKPPPPKIDFKGLFGFGPPPE